MWFLEFYSNSCFNNQQELNPQPKNYQIHYYLSRKSAYEIIFARIRFRPDSDL